MRRLVGRLLLVPLTLLGVTLCTFVLIHLAPGDPASLRAGAGRGVTQAIIDENRALAGLDRPPVERYLAWVARSARLDFGRSLSDGRPVRERLAEALPPTLLLGGLAALFAFGLAVVVGTMLALPAARRWQALVEALLALAYAVPVVAFGLLALRAGAPYGGTSPGTLLVPAACLGLPSLVVMARQQRAALVASLASDYVRTARSLGASPARVLVRHALPPALLPMIALAGSQVPLLLSGSVLVERLFGIPGLGLLGFEALAARDYPTLMAITTVAGALSVAGLLVADAAALLLDPRQRWPGAGR